MDKDEFAVLPDEPEKQHRDNVKPEDRDPRLPYEDPEGEDNVEMKQQSQLDDTPLDYNTEDTLRGGDDAKGENPHELRHDENGGDADSVEPAFSDAIGDSSQQRLREEEQGLQNKDQLLQNNSNFKLDNTGLNMKPDEQPVFDQGTSKVISQDDYMSEITKKENPLEKEGDPLQDGMVMKPDEIRQNDGLDTSLQTGQIDINDPNAKPLDGDNNAQGVDTEDIDPNILHYDPESGRNYTDLTDEQGNEVPDLRFDQSPNSDEEQPEVELENPIVTKEEYEQEKKSARGESPMISEDDFNAELDKKSTDPDAENPFDLEGGNEIPEKPNFNGTPKEESKDLQQLDEEQSKEEKPESKPKEKFNDGKEPEDLGKITEEPKKEKKSKQKKSNPETGKNNTGGKKKKEAPKDNKKETGKNNTGGKKKIYYRRTWNNRTNTVIKRARLGW